MKNEENILAKVAEKLSPIFNLQLEETSLEPEGFFVSFGEPLGSLKV